MADAIDCFDAGDPKKSQSSFGAAHQRTEKMVMEKPDDVGIAFKPRKPKPSR